MSIYFWLCVACVLVGAILDWSQDVFCVLVLPPLVGAEPGANMYCSARAPLVFVAATRWIRFLSVQENNIKVITEIIPNITLYFSINAVMSCFTHLPMDVF